MIPKKLYEVYRKRGFKDDQICTILECTKKQLNDFKKANGYIHTHLDISPELLAEAEKLGLSPDAIKWRMETKHWTAEEACRTPKHQATVTAEQLNRAKKRYNLHPSTVYRRLQRGWELETALTTSSVRKRKSEIQQIIEVIQDGGTNKQMIQEIKDILNI